MAENEKVVVPGLIDNVEALEAKMKAMREAQKIFATYSQEQVDKIFYEAAMAANKQRIPLAKMAVEETQRGVMEDKVIKNHYAAEYIYNAYKNTKTCGVIEEDPAYGIKKSCRADRTCCSGYPDNKPDIYSYFQNSDLSEDKERDHHQPASGCKEMYDRGSKGCSRGGSKSRSSGRNHRMDRCSVT